MVYYYDATALGSNYAVNEQDFRWVVVHEFERHGWTVEAVYLGNPMRHDEKYLLINQGFAGKQRLMPFFNRQNNDDLILAIQAAGEAAAATVFARTKAERNLPSRKKTSSSTAQTAPMLSIPSTSAARNFRIGKVILSRQREFCSVAVNGKALASGLAVLVGEAGARSLAS